MAISPEETMRNSSGAVGADGWRGPLLDLAAGVARAPVEHLEQPPLGLRVHRMREPGRRQHDFGRAADEADDVVVSDLACVFATTRNGHAHPERPRAPGQRDAQPGHRRSAVSKLTARAELADERGEVARGESFARPQRDSRAHEQRPAADRKQRRSGFQHDALRTDAPVTASERERIGAGARTRAFGCGRFGPGQVCYTDIYGICEYAPSCRLGDRRSARARPASAPAAAEHARDEKSADGGARTVHPSNATPAAAGHPTSCRFPRCTHSLLLGAYGARPLGAHPSGHQCRTRLQQWSSTLSRYAWLSRSAPTHRSLTAELTAAICCERHSQTLSVARAVSAEADGGVREATGCLRLPSAVRGAKLMQHRVATTTSAFGLLRRRQLVWLAKQAAGAALLGSPSLVIRHTTTIVDICLRASALGHPEHHSSVSASRRRRSK